MAITGPIALYNNLPIHADYYQPSRFVISAITLGLNTTITTTENTNYVIGQLVRLLIPNEYGTRELNNQTGYVIDLPDVDQVTLDINSQGFQAFTDAGLPTKAQIVAVGDQNSGYQSATGSSLASINIPGSFINIS